MPPARRHRGSCGPYRGRKSCPQARATSTRSWLTTQGRSTPSVRADILFCFPLINEYSHAPARFPEEIAATNFTLSMFFLTRTPNHPHRHAPAAARRRPEQLLPNGDGFRLPAAGAVRAPRAAVGALRRRGRPPLARGDPRQRQQRLRVGRQHPRSPGDGQREGERGGEPARAAQRADRAAGGRGGGPGGPSARAGSGARGSVARTHGAPMLRRASPCASALRAAVLALARAQQPFSPALQGAPPTHPLNHHADPTLAVSAAGLRRVDAQRRGRPRRRPLGVGVGRLGGNPHVRRRLLRWAAGTRGRVGLLAAPPRGGAGGGRRSRAAGDQGALFARARVGAVVPVSRCACAAACSSVHALSSCCRSCVLSAPPPPLCACSAAAPAQVSCGFNHTAVVVMREAKPGAGGRAR